MQYVKQFYNPRGLGNRWSLFSGWRSFVVSWKNSLNHKLLNRAFSLSLDLGLKQQRRETILMHLINEFIQNSFDTPTWWSWRHMKTLYKEYTMIFQLSWTDIIGIWNVISINMIYQCLFSYTKHIISACLSSGNVTTVNAFQKNIDVTGILIVKIGRTRSVVVS